MALPLRDALCRAEAQNHILMIGAEALHLLGSSMDRTECLIGHKPTSLPVKPRNGGNAIARALAHSSSSTAPSTTLDRVAGFFQSVATSSVDDITRPWCVLCIFLLFPKSRECVGHGTDVRFAPFFDGNSKTILPYDDRLSLKLCGTGSKQAMTPVEIVISELQLYSILMNHV